MWTLRAILICISLMFFRLFTAIKITRLRMLSLALCPIFKRVICILMSNFLSSLYVLDNSPLLDVELMKIFAQSVGCELFLMKASFDLQLNEIPFINSQHEYLSHCSGQKVVSGTDKFKTITYFLFYKFCSFAFTLSPLIHLDLSFVQGDKYGSNCILLHADILVNSTIS